MSTTSPNDGPSPWAKRIVQNFKYFMSEGGLALILVIIFGIGALISDVYEAVFQFPPDWRPVLRLMLPIVALTSWSLVRVWMRQSSGGEKLLSGNKAPTAKKGRRKGEKGNKHAAVTGDTPARESTRLKARLSWLLIAGGIFVFFVYFIFSNTYTLLSTEVEVQPDTRSDVILAQAAPRPNVILAQAATRPEPQEVFVLPFPPVQKFDDALKWRGGKSYVVDNDKYWLADRLTDPDVATRVLITKCTLMVLLMVAVALLISGTTVLTFLPKRGFGHEDGIEAGASGGASHFPSPHI